MAATNSNLEEMVQEGSFREDLYYRINIIPIHLPPLRERREDILLLAEHFREKFARSMGKDIRSISKDAARLLEEYRWPGNVRELENVIERAVALEETESILPERLQDRLAAPSSARNATELPTEGLNLTDHLDDVARSLILAALDRTGGVQKEAAQLLGLSFRSFRYHLNKYGIRPK